MGKPHDRIEVKVFRDRKLYARVNVYGVSPTDPQETLDAALSHLWDKKWCAVPGAELFLLGEVPYELPVNSVKRLYKEERRSAIFV